VTRESNLRIWWIIPLLFIMVLFYPFADGKVMYLDDDTITATASLLRDSYALGQPVPIEIAVTNHGQEPVYTYVDEFGFLELGVTVEDVNGTKIEHGPIPEPPPPPRYYWLTIDGKKIFTVPVIEIASGQTTKLTIPDALDLYYDYLQEGVYYLTPRELTVIHEVGSIITREDQEHKLWIEPSVVIRRARYGINKVEISLHQEKIIYVDDDAVGLNDGSSWQNAYNHLQDALADAEVAEKPVEIRIAQGIYKPDQGMHRTPSDREATFQLINSVTLRGGYAGFGETDPNAHDIEAYETILSGDLDGNDTDEIDLLRLSSESTRAENSFHVVTGSGTDDSAILDGFTITAGNARYPSPDSRGGGMYNNSGNPTVTNCTFRTNAASLDGGGIYNYNSNSNLTNCIFIRNWSIGGAGIYNLNSSPTLIDCTYTENSTVGNYLIEIQDLRGGIIFNQNSDSTLINCTFNANQSVGMWNQASNPTMINCTFSINEDNGIVNRGSNPILTGCKFTGNSARGMYNSGHSEPRVANSIFSGNKGGGVYDGENCRTTLTSCTLTGNSARSGGGIFSKEHISVLINCILWDNTPDQTTGLRTIKNSNIQGGVPGEQNIDVDPLFAKPGYWADANDPNIIVDSDDPNAVWIEGDYHLKSQADRWDAVSESWVVDNVTSPCIDAGDPNMPVGDEPEPNGGRINMGAYGGTPEASKSISTINRRF